MAHWLIARRYFGAHRLRSALTALGVAFGVAAVSGGWLLNDAAGRSYRRTIDKLAGKSVLQVTNGDPGVPEELVDELRELPGVAAVEGSVQGFVPLEGGSGERLYILGMDLLADLKIWDHELSNSDGTIQDPIVFVAQADSLAVSREFLRALALRVGDRIEVRGPKGLISLKIRAALDLETGLASLFGGRLAVMDQFAAQELFGLDRRFTEIDIAARDGADPAALEQAVRAVVAGRGSVGTPEMRGRTVEQLMAGSRFGMLTAGVIAVLVGTFLAFNSMMIGVEQRRREIGLLRLVGMTRREVVRQICGEALLLGAVASVVGVLGGYALARLLSTAFIASISQRYVPIDAAPLQLTSLPMLLGGLVGPLCAVLAVLPSLRSLLAAEPVSVVRATAPTARSDAASVRLCALLAALVLAAAALLWMLREPLQLDPSVVGTGAALGLLVGLSLLAPLLYRWFLLTGAPFFAILSATLGEMVRQNLLGHLRVTLVTCAGFVISLGGAIGIASVFAAVHLTLRTWNDATFRNVDLIVSSKADPSSPDALPFPDAIAAEVASWPQVRALTAVRQVKLQQGSAIIRIAATDTRAHLDGHHGFSIVHGDVRAATESVARGDGVIVNETYARAFDKWLGDAIRLASPNGAIVLPIVGITLDFNEAGQVYLSRELYREHWRDRSVNRMNILLDSPRHLDDVSRAIRQRWGDRYELFMITAAGYRAEQEALLDRAAASMYPIVALALLVALLGVTNSLYATIQSRRSQLGALRAVGATRRQLTRMLILEGGAIGLVSGGIAVIFGSIFGVWATYVFVELFHTSLLYSHATREALAALPLTVLLAGAAGYLPARRVARISPAEVFLRD